MSMVVYHELFNILGNPGYNELMDMMDVSAKMQHERVVESLESRLERRLGDEMSLVRKEVVQLKEYMIDRMDAQFKWMVAMWLTQMIAISGIFVTILQLVVRGHG